MRCGANEIASADDINVSAEPRVMFINPVVKFALGDDEHINEQVSDAKRNKTMHRVFIENFIRQPVVIIVIVPVQHFAISDVDAEYIVCKLFDLFAGQWFFGKIGLINFTSDPYKVL